VLVQVQELEAEHQQLRTRETVMLQMLEEQDRSLHHLALQMLQEDEQQYQWQPAAAIVAAATSRCTESTQASSEDSEPHCPEAAAAEATAAAAAAAEMTNSAAASSIAAALMADVRSYELLQQMGGWPSLDSQQHSQEHDHNNEHTEQQASSQDPSRQLNLRVQDWREVATTCQEAAGQISRASLAKLAEQLRSKTMRLGYLLHAGRGMAPGCTALPMSCLASALEDYVRFVSLLHGCAVPADVLVSGVRFV
jgi:hypothetical protein